MPYTPPSQHSPVASRPESPTLSRNHSYNKVQQPASASFTTSPRPGLPRSASSTSYLHKHRRSPSVTKPSVFGAAPSTPDATPLNTTFSAAQQGNTSDQVNRGRPFSPPVNGISIPQGSVISPPDSAQNSSDEETHAGAGRTRELENLAELQAAIRIIEQHRESSPNRANEATKKARMALGLVVPDRQSAPVEQTTSPRPPLSKEARRISHSRSATESSVYLESPQPFGSPGRSRSASDSEQEDSDELRNKPPMVRKKSGELVRPAIRPQSSRRRPSSMPGTPTYSKAVHFDSNLEHVRHFLQVDRPLAVSAGSSPVEAYESDVEFPFTSKSDPPFQWEIRLTNFPEDSPERRTMPVRVEKVFLSSDNKILIGSVAVANLSFHKLVVARFTLDYWKTTSEVVAEYSNDIRRKQADDGYDRFNFSIKLEDQANLETKTMFFCVRYNVNGQEFWDSNNNNINFQIDFAKKPLPQKGKQGMPGNASRPLNSLPRSRPSPPTSAGRPRPKTTSFEEFGTGHDFGSFPQPASMTLSDAPMRLKNAKVTGKVVPDAPNRRANGPAQAFGNRYDFGASLSAAIQAANGGLQFKEEESSEPKVKKTSFVPRPFMDASSAKAEPSVGLNTRAGDSVKGPADASPSKATPAQQKPAALTSGKPSLQSQSYHELLDKYCFFGSAKSSPQLQKPGKGQIDGTSDDVPESEIKVDEPSHSASRSPPISRPIEEIKSTPVVTSPRLSRSASSTSSSYGSRAVSPNAFGYPYRQPLQNGFFADSYHSTAIRG
ncbi:hypothetical protein MMC30_003312 [Trapelia coarctata]|nr:hypothetical protein [Trapelia coarctata]